jgi:S-DNA-T family DNA segregation ATPase FtsK/SpoIIIE
VIQPRPAPAERRDARDDARRRWSKLVYEAGCAILEQKRVAVSMLERRFGIDFDRPARSLDELQQAGLIGPYMGGRTRDILLTREEWLAHAPHAS